MPEVEPQLVLRLIEQVFNAGNLEQVDQLVHPDFFDHGAPASRAVGQAGLQATVRLLRHAFAGFRIEPIDVIAADGKVVVRATASGRHVGAINGIEPTGEEWLAPQFHIFRVAEGRVIEHWANRDDFSTLRKAAQLGTRAGQDPTERTDDASSVSRCGSQAGPMARSPNA